MKLFKHEGPGHYIGSCVIVKAKTLEEAEEIIRQTLDRIGLNKEPLVNVQEIDKNDTIVYLHSGDY